MPSYDGFQSLLCWIMVCKSQPFTSRELKGISFNPCYVGLWSVSPKQMWIIMRLTLVSILVMLDYGL